MMDLDAALNWIWQGTAIALAASLALLLLRRARAADRFTFCAASLLAVLLLPAVQGLGWLLAPAGTALPLAGRAGPVVPLPDTWWTSGTLVLLAASAWIAVYAVRLAGALLVLRRLRAACVPLPDVMEDGLAAWNRWRATGRGARLALSREIQTAAVLGGGRPIIAVSESLAASLPPDALDRIVVHEWAHVQRRDDLTALVQLVVRAVAGWHPAVWWLDRQLAIEREAACDEMAVTLTGSRKQYASSLVAAAGAARSEPRRLAALGVLSPSGQLESRVRRVLAHDRLASRGRSGGRAAAALAGVAAVCVTAGSLPIVGIAVTDAVAAVPSGVAAARAAVRAGAARFTTPAPEEARAGTVRRAPGPPPPIRRSVAQARTPGTPLRLASREPAALIARAEAPLPPDAGVIAHRSLAGSPPMTGRAAGDDALQAFEARDGDLARPPPSGTPGTPWGAAARAGTAVSRGSRQAAVTTAGFFTGFGKKVAASF